MNWQKGLKVRVESNAPLRSKTTFRIGGRARWFACPKDAVELSLLVRAAKKHRLPVYVLGAGSNILVSDKGLKALVIKLDSPFFNRSCPSGTDLEAGSGIMLSRLIRKAGALGLSGLEFLSGIPGSLGGALAMNAGCFGKSIMDLVESCEVMDYNGRIKNLNKKGIRYGYRSSGLSDYVILGATLGLTRKDRAVIRKDEQDYLRKRRSTQDAALPNAGCIFKNPEDSSAGRLIDLCGLKGRRIGRAQVSRRHANFILNCGNASSCDVVKLMNSVRRQVKNKFGIVLEPEIKIWK
ncbi:MAG: UDP-N-acetylmuramate dehydrogenase [Candidatus Omnitrophica bacterium]|nr:UDP-N-acetylmuramate dehydrogenase [Candidatus Omnitrophota bacterium]